MDRAHLAAKGDVARWVNEANQLLAILISSARTARERGVDRSASQPTVNPVAGLD